MSNFKVDEREVVFIYSNAKTIELIDTKELEELIKVLDTDIRSLYGEVLENTEEEFDNLKSVFYDLESNIEKIEGFLSTLIEELDIKIPINMSETRKLETESINDFLWKEESRILKFGREFEYHKNIINDYGEKEIKVYYYFCKKGYFKGDPKTHLFLYPQGIWHENEWDYIKISDIVSKNDEFEHYKNILKMEKRVLIKIDNSTAPYFIKEIVGNLIKTKISEFEEAYNRYTNKTNFVFNHVL